MNHDELFATGAADDGPSRPPDERTSSLSGTNPYADLKRIVKKHGLLNRQPAYSAAKTAFTLCLLAVSLALLPILGSTWLQLANAVYLAVVFVQLSFLAHEVGSRRENDQREAGAQKGRNRAEREAKARGGPPGAPAG